MAGRKKTNVSLPAKKKRSTPQYATKADLLALARTANHPTHAQLDASIEKALDKALEPYARTENHPTHAQLDASIEKALDKALEPYARTENHPTHAQLDASIAKALENHPTHAQLDASIAKALENHPTHAQLDASIAKALENHPTHAQLDASIAKALAPYARTENHPTKQELAQAFETWTEVLLNYMRTELIRDLRAELAQHVGASREDMQQQVAVVDEKYSDLPARVTALEERAEHSAK